MHTSVQIIEIISQKSHKNQFTIKHIFIKYIETVILVAHQRLRTDKCANNWNYELKIPWQPIHYQTIFITKKVILVAHQCVTQACKLKLWVENTMNFFFFFFFFFEKQNTMKIYGLFLVFLNRNVGNTNKWNLKLMSKKAQPRGKA